MTGQPVKLLLDEHIWMGLTEALKKRGYDAIHVITEDLRSMDDGPLFALAADQGRAVLTYNVSDFAPLVTVWYEAGKEHAGVIFSTPQPPGELLRQIANLLEKLSADDLKNTSVWLQSFRG